MGDGGWWWCGGERMNGHGIFGKPEPLRVCRALGCGMFRKCVCGGVVSEDESE